MKRHLTSLLFSTLSALVCGNCIGQSIVQYSHATNGARVFTEMGGGLSWPESGFHAYDNWRTPSFGGISRFRGTLSAGTDELADELYLTTTGPALLSDIGFGIFNTSATSQLSSYRFTIRFYDDQRTLLGFDTFANGGAINANSGVAFYSDGGFYEGFGIVLPTHALMSIQVTEIVGIDPSDLAVLLSGPRTTGYSSQFVYDFSSGQTLNPDGTDQTNLRFFIDTTEIPSPASVGVMVGVLPLALRRRR